MWRAYLFICIETRAEKGAGPRQRTGGQIWQTDYIPQQWYWFVGQISQQNWTQGHCPRPDPGEESQPAWHAHIQCQHRDPHLWAEWRRRGHHWRGRGASGSWAGLCAAPAKAALWAADRCRHGAEPHPVSVAQWTDMYHRTTRLARLSCPTLTPPTAASPKGYCPARGQCCLWGHRAWNHSQVPVLCSS